MNATYLQTPDESRRVEIVSRTCASPGNSGSFYRVTERALVGGGWYLIGEVRSIAELAKLVDLAELREASRT